jgi:hypothetical protein
MKFILALLLTPLFIGCYSLEKKYNYGESFHNSPDMWTEEDPQFEVGEPIPVVDSTGHYVFSLFSKLIFLNWKVDNHNISEETIEITKNYIRENNLRSVKVRFNQYAPISELKRIWRNDHINPAIKYTFGLIGWFSYTLLPERIFAGLFGGDHYNPFSNSVHIYSDLPSIAIHEGGHAKDFNSREFKTMYAAIYSIPIIGALYHEAVATDDTLAYFQEKEDDEKIIESYKILSPAYATYIGGSIGDIAQTPLSILSVIPGHIFGWFKVRKFRKSREEESEEENDTSIETETESEGE